MDLSTTTATTKQSLKLTNLKKIQDLLITWVEQRQKSVRESKRERPNANAMERGGEQNTEHTYVIFFMFIKLFFFYNYYYYYY